MGFFSTKHFEQDEHVCAEKNYSSVTDKPIADSPDTRHTINRIALQQLLNKIHRSDFLETLIVLYLRDSNLCNQCLEQASQTGDYVLWRKTLHELKGMANNLCLERLSDAIAKAHSLSQENFIAGSQVELASLQDVMRQAEFALKESLDKPVS